MFPEVTILVWYHKELDEIFMNTSVDALFYTLGALNWNKLYLLGEL